MTVTVGFIGTGRMGAPMCRHIMAAGYPLVAFDRSATALEAVAGQGARTAGSAAEVAALADVTFVMTGFYDQVEDAVAGPAGLLSATSPGDLVIVSSTITPQQACSLAGRCGEHGVLFLDAPVCQGERGAEEAYLVWLVGGPADAAERARPIMSACGSDIFHLGDAGAGMTGKALNNMLLWAALVADHEALEIGRRHGVEPSKLIPALLRSSGTNWPLEHWADMHRIPWAHKDMTIVLDMADTTGLTVPLAGLLREQVKPVMLAAGIDPDLIRTR